MKTWRNLGASSAVAVLATVGLVGSALADGGPGRRGKAVQECCINWGGLYFGAHLGYQWNDIDVVWTQAPPGAPNFAANPIPEINQDDAIAGIHIGLQHQFGAAVLGIEAGLTSTLGRFNHLEPILGPGIVPGATMGARVDNILFVGPRLGWSVGNWMPYVTGGYASAAIQTQAVNVLVVPNIVINKSRDRHEGWYIGAGVDWALHCCDSNWVLGVEYRHYEFDEGVHLAHGIGGGLVPTDNRRVDASSDSISVRLSYKIGRAAQPLK